MRSVLPVNQLQIREAQVELINQRRSLKSVAVALSGHAALGCSMQLAINLRRQFFEGLLIAVAPCLKQYRDLVSEGLRHTKASEPQGGRAVTRNITTATGLCRPDDPHPDHFFLRYRFCPPFSL